MSFFLGNNFALFLAETSYRVCANHVWGMNSQELFRLIHLSKNGASWSLDSETVVGLPGAHGSEIVRSFCFVDEQQVVFTAGEDSCIKAWRPSA